MPGLQDVEERVTKLEEAGVSQEGRITTMREDLTNLTEKVENQRQALNNLGENVGDLVEVNTKQWEHIVALETKLQEAISEHH